MTKGIEAVAKLRPKSARSYCGGPAAELLYKLRCDDFRLQHAPANREMDHGEGDFPIQFYGEVAPIRATMIRSDELFVGYRSQLFLLGRNKHKSCQSFWEK